MVDRKKKMLRRNGYRAAVCALLLAGMLSGCAGGGDGGAQSGAPSENAQQAESGGSQAEKQHTFPMFPGQGGHKKDVLTHIVLGTFFFCFSC